MEIGDCSGHVADELFDESGVIPDFMFVGEGSEADRDALLIFVRTWGEVERLQLLIQKELPPEPEPVETDTGGRSVRAVELIDASLAELSKMNREAVPHMSAVQESFEELRKKIEEKEKETEMGCTPETIQLLRDRLHRAGVCVKILSSFLDWSRTCTDLVQRGICLQERLLNMRVAHKLDYHSKIAPDLLLVRGLFSAVLGMFSFRGLLPQHVEHWIESDSFVRFLMKNEVMEANAKTESGVVKNMHRLGKSLLINFFPRNGRLWYMIWKSDVFQRGVAKELRSNAEDLREKADLQEGLKEIEPTLKIFELTELNKKAVEGLNRHINSRVDEGGSGGEERGALDFASFFCAFYWHAVEESAKPSEAKNEKKGRIQLWGEWCRRVEVFGMAEEVRKGHRLAFASTAAVVDARSLYEDSLSECAPDGCNWEGKRLHFIYRVKGIEMSLQNPKLAKRIEKERGKVVKVLRQMERKWERVREMEEENLINEMAEKEDPAWYWERAAFEMEEFVAQNFFALLILYLDPSSPQNPSSSSASAKHSRKQVALMEWFERHRPVTAAAQGSEMRKKGKKSSSDSKQQPEGGVPPSPFTSLRDLSLFSLSDFLNDHILSVSENSFGYYSIDYSHKGADEREASRKASRQRTCKSLMNGEETKTNENIPYDNCGRCWMQAKHCVACQLAVYCSRDCQRAH
uniref:MYND-type domain-containing protein n=1 Tax=Chromera velia CCMP2878 TaxID=1169474 RepID=A0A0G4GNA5_9ALVE|eukprot:Cvel_4956.t1-p1 / transcript=Cvel_4956.t1 / gene=Cvel_4956 / organism=Chromera_velia_CCMP2878 / gene_product=hypothetical protein / transcript_product=hypothetical protein / location=Cvel_scaffold224:24571-26637(-) / protein_length=689 / sequence_SO=supercontig / SO=protein_coding / is_pseudo=false